MENKKVVNIDMKQYGMVLALIAVYVIFAIMTGGKNLSPANINNLIMQNGYIVILAVGMLLCVLTGNVDLGVGSIVATCGAVIGIGMVDYGWNMWIAIIAALIVGLLCGMFAGFFISKLGIPPFIVTLATMLMGRGLTYVLLQAQTKGPLPADFVYIGAGFLPTIKVGSIDLVCLIVAAVISVLIVMAELKSIATKKKYGFATNPTWQLMVKDGIIIAIVWFFFYKLACYSGYPVRAGAEWRFW